MQIQTVDYQSHAAPELFAHSLKETGFAVLVNHPVDIRLIANVYQQWQDFFCSDDKYHYLFKPPAQDGYFPFRSENAKDISVKDLKEFYHFYLHGIKPVSTEIFSLQIYRELEQLAGQLLQWIEDFLPTAVAKNLSTPLSEMILKSQNTLLRILHYPPLSPSHEKNAVRAAAHEDINLLTLLPAATAPGLEVLDMYNQWHPVSCDSGNIVVNVGDMLQKCTEFYYKSTTHRVVNPPSDKNCSRFSMPFFLHAREDVLIGKNQTAAEYLHERLREIGIGC